MNQVSCTRSLVSFAAEFVADHRQCRPNRELLGSCRHAKPPRAAKPTVVALLLVGPALTSLPALAAELTDIGTLNGGNYAGAYAISADGAVVVGDANDGLSGYGRAFRWTQSGGMVSLGTLNGGNVSTATRVNTDARPSKNRDMAFSRLRIVSGISKL